MGVEQAITNGRLDVRKVLLGWERRSMKKKILLVDDDRLFLGVTARGIESVGSEYQVIAEHNGQQALEYLKSEKIDLLITDLVMPGMTGSDLLMYMLNGNIRMPVIILSGYVLEKELPLANLGGTCAYLSKPVGARALVGTIRKCLERMAAGEDSSVSLTTLLQLFALDQKTCTLLVHGKGKAGTIVFLRGTLSDVHVAELKGDKALAEILSFPNPQVVVVANHRKR
jgi:CheY-like chemotaxis protein